MTVDAAGNRTVVGQAYDADGSLAYAITSVTSRDGLSVTNSHDDNQYSISWMQGASAMQRSTPSVASADFH